MMLRPYLVLSSLATALLLTGPALTQETAATPAAVATTDPAQKVAVVNGEAITMADVTGFLSVLDPQVQRQPLEMIYEQLVDRLVLNKLVIVEATKEGLLDRPEIQRKLALARDQVLFEAFLTEKMESLVADADVQALYDATTGKEVNDQVRARHILVETEDEAKSIIKQLEEGADFAELAKSKSQDPGAANGGDLGFFGKGQMVPEFEAAAFALEPGQITKEPVKSQFGWHVIKLEEKRAGPATAFEEVKDQLRQQLMGEKAQAYLEGLKSAAKVDRFGMDGAPAPIATELPAPAMEEPAAPAATATPAP